MNGMFSALKLILAAIGVIGCTQTVHGAGNFEFVIKGQPGLKLVVAGLTGSGKIVFQDSVSAPEKRKGETLYVLRVDEELLKQNRLAQWCVVDTTGKWKALPKGRTQVALCDDNPQETGGSYVFSPRTEKSTSVVVGEQKNQSETAFNLKIGKDVPSFQVQTILDGFEIAQKHLAALYGGPIDPIRQKRIRVRIEASGKGDKAEGEGSPAAMTWTKKGPNLYFDVIHPQYNRGDSEYGWTTQKKNMKVAIHEYVHAWQSVLANGVPNSGKWIDEGIAEFLAFDAMVSAGQMKQADVNDYLVKTAKRSDGTSLPLKTYVRTSIWPGEIGAVAISWLIDESPNGRKSLRVYAESLASGHSVKKAFAKAFNIQLDDFYGQFEVYRAIINAHSPQTAIGLRPKLKTL
jgi:hypothetical protein